MSSKRIGEGTRRPALLLPPILAGAAGLICAFWVADVGHPPAIFPKYLEAALLSPAQLGDRLGDYSPLYLVLTRVLAPGGWQDVLRFQAVLHAGTAAAVALAVAALAGPAWAAAAGLAAAAYRPFLVYAGIHEPENAIVFCLAVAIACGAWARRLLRQEVAALAGPALAAGAGLALAAAGLLRPQHLLLLPIWACWVALAPGRGWKRPYSSVAGAVLLAALAVLLPFFAARWRATGSLTIMDPGAVFYEGNAPGATGLRSHAPAVILALEKAHPGESDYRHVAYRRIAAYATSGARPALTAVTGGAAPRAASASIAPGAANRYWTRLAWEGIAAWPRRAAARFGRKALLALMPYEAHDLVVAEHLDRRVRRRLPWGFALLAVALPWLLLARRRRLADLAGPVAVAALAFAVQVAFFASARQRLPLALALLVIGPALLADLAGGRLRAGVRRPLAVGFGVVAAAALAVAGGRWAILDQIEWDEMLGRRPPALAERLVRVQDGQAGRRGLREDALFFRAALGRYHAGDLDAALPALADLAGAGRDYTVDGAVVDGVPEYWLARACLARGDRRCARVALAAALCVRPDGPRILALATRRSAPGVDPASAGLLLAEAADLSGHPHAAAALRRLIAPAVPELAGGPSRVAAGAPRRRGRQFRCGGCAGRGRRG